MRHELSGIGDAFALRPVTLEDSEFIIELRTNPQLSRHIHATSADPTAQRAWIERYFARPGDYYFIIENRITGRPEGTISIYDQSADGAEAEWGRWILAPGSAAAVESVLLLYRIAFGPLDLGRLFCRTLARNEKVVSFHASCGLVDGGLLPGAFEIDGAPVDAREQYITAGMWTDVEAKLAPLAARTARLVQRRQAQ